MVREQTYIIPSTGAFGAQFPLNIYVECRRGVRAASIGWNSIRLFGILEPQSLLSLVVCTLNSCRRRWVSSPNFILRMLPKRVVRTFRPVLGECDVM